jgi:hypothetical protein
MHAQWERRSQQRARQKSLVFFLCELLLSAQTFALCYAGAVQADAGSPEDDALVPSVRENSTAPRGVATTLRSSGEGEARS